jgi:hypothetical protein
MGLREGELFAGLIHIGLQTAPPVERDRPNVDRDLPNLGCQRGLKRITLVHAWPRLGDLAIWNTARRFHCPKPPSERVGGS